MGGVCLLVAGSLAAFLPATEFTLAWRHSVEKTLWRERYHVEGARLALVEASVEGNGAGMEPGPGARVAQGRWTWQPAMPPLPELRLTVSDFTADYDVCWNGRCERLAALARATGDAVVVVQACDPPAAR
jgi:hypothetical protein